MRQLIFRIWNGSEMVYDVMVGKFGAFYVNPGSRGDGLDDNDKASLTTFTTKYHDETSVMQLTGLKDKNGKDIYEGDIVKGYAPYEGEDNEQIFEMKWDEAGGWVIHWASGFNGGESDMTLFGWAKFEDYQFEVIGNIYENPELIKQV